MTETTAAPPVRAVLTGLAGLALAAVPLVTACTADGDDASPSTTPEPTAEPTSGTPTEEPTGPAWEQLEPRWTTEDSAMPPLYEHDEAFGFVSHLTRGLGARGNVTFPSTAGETALATVFMGAPNTDVASLILVALDAETGEHRWSWDTGFGAACAPDGELLACTGERIDPAVEPPIDDHPFAVLDLASGEVPHETVVAAPGMRTVVAEDSFVTAGYSGEEIVLTRLTPEAEILWEARQTADPGPDGRLELTVAGGAVEVMDGTGAMSYADLATGEPATEPEDAVIDVAWSGGTMRLTAPIPDDGSAPTEWTAHDDSGAELWQLSVRGAPQWRSAAWEDSEHLVFAGAGEVTAVTPDGEVAGQWSGDVGPRTIQGAALAVTETEVTGYDLLTGATLWTVPVEGEVFVTERGWFVGVPDERGGSTTLTYYEPKRLS